MRNTSYVSCLTLATTARKTSFPRQRHVGSPLILRLSCRTIRYVLTELLLSVSFPFASCRSTPSDLIGGDTCPVNKTLYSVPPMASAGANSSDTTLICWQTLPCCHFIPAKTLVRKERGAVSPSWHGYLREGEQGRPSALR